MKIIFKVHEKKQLYTNFLNNKLIVPNDKELRKMIFFISKNIPMMDELKNNWIM